MATANQDLENTAVDIPKVFGANSPEAQQLAADPDSFKDAETADYVGIAVHCARGSAFCSIGQGGEVRADHADPDRGYRHACPTSPVAIAATRPCSATATSPRNSAPEPPT